MATLCKTFPSNEFARDAAGALRAAGVPTADIGVLTGQSHDGRVGDLSVCITRPDGNQDLDAIDDDGARRLLTDARVPDDVARRMVRHLHEGEAVMFVQLSHVDLSTAEALTGHRTVTA